MAATRELALPWWTWAAPLAAWGLVAVERARPAEGDVAVFVMAASVVLGATVFAAVHHAETVAARIGETVGVVLLGLAVTTIEVSLIASVTFGTPEDATTVARDTVFAGVMVVLNGVVGLSLLTGGLLHREQHFQLQGTASALAVLGTLAFVTMVLPDYTVAGPGPVFSPTQLVFVIAASLCLVAVFLFAQTVSQRGYFAGAADETDAEVAPVAGRTALVAAAMLVVALAAVVMLAEGLAPAVQRGVAAAGLPQECVGVVIAGLVLLPEGTSALRAARRNRIQTSLNLALGSAIQSTGLTIPAIAILSLVLDAPIALGLEPEHVVLIALTLFVATLTLSTGRTTVLQGAVHLMIFAVFLVIAAVP